MKIIVIGGTGTIGSAINTLLMQDHETIAVGKTKGAYQVDIESKASIEEFFKKVGNVDAIISATGNGEFSPFSDPSDNAYDVALNNKIMGQVNLTRIGLGHLNQGGNIILTSGEATQHPMPKTASIAMGCAAIDAFVAVAALELEKGHRINVVSPAFVKESMEQFGLESSSGIPAAKVAEYYRDLVMGEANGQVIRAKN